MEYPSPSLFQASRLFSIKATHWAPNGNTDFLPHQRHRSRDRHGLHHKEDSWLWLSGANESVAHCHVAKDKVGPGKKGLQ